MLSGQRAFRGDSAADTMSAILKEEPPDLSVTNQSISPALERIVRHCLEKNPERRFHSAHDLGFDLESLSGASATGRPAVSGGAGRAGRRWLVPAVLAALALLAMASAFELGRRRKPVSAAETTFTQLTHRQEPIFNARFAPDGKTVVYSSAPWGNQPQIFSLRPDYPGSSARSQPGIALLSVSSRGELAVLTNARYIRHSLFVGTLARMPLEGGAPREILEGVREADWAPDGSDLVVIREVGGKDRLEFPVGKVICETGGYFSNPRFSRKGDRIAFFDHPLKYDDRGSVAVVDLAGKKTVLSEGYWAEEGLAWSADGSEVMFSAGDSYNDMRVFAVSATRRRRTALRTPGGMTMQDVAADGRWIASRDDVFRDTVSLAPGQDRERDLSWLDLTYAVVLSPDGKTLLMTEESASVGAGYSTVLRGTDGSPVVRLGDGAALDLSRDGKWALAALSSAPSQMVLYPVGAGAPKKLPRGALVSYETATLFPDGRRVVACGHETGHAVRCYVQDVEGGPVRAITPEGTTEGFASPDGREVVVRENGKGLRIYAADGSTSRVVPGSTPEDAVMRWSADGRSLLVARVWDVPSRVESLDVATGARTPFQTLGPANLTGVLQIGPIAISDDGKTRVFTNRRMVSHLFLVTGAL
jgi:Tol biopolymer transport system component